MTTREQLKDADSDEMIAELNARKAAESKQPRLSKLRDAWTAISPYYAQQ